MPAPSLAAAPSTTTTTPSAVAARPETTSVYFGVGSANPPEDSASKLAPLIEWARGTPDTTLQLSGYHDKTGDPAQNQELAKRRAQAIAALLVAAGVEQARIQFKEPVETTGGGDDREARRVDVTAAR
ncbi:MAG: OmpA family protein [Lautropia sp.]